MCLHVCMCSCTEAKNKYHPTLSALFLGQGIPLNTELTSSARLACLWSVSTSNSSLSSSLLYLLMRFPKLGKNQLLDRYSLSLGPFSNDIHLNITRATVHCLQIIYFSTESLVKDIKTRSRLLFCGLPP